jgi:3,4-dihydroxy 2-butanone 4-phosphate synthase/GTP cyclohydrolase II
MTSATPGGAKTDSRTAPRAPEAVRIETALRQIADGRIVIVTDDAARENEGDLIMAASAATPEHLAFFLEHTAGLICVGLEARRADQLELPLMVADGTDPRGTAFTISVDLNDRLTTGISAIERARTIAALANPDRVAADFVRPGHVFPLRAREGGVLRRAGHTEAAVDLARLAGLDAAGVLCEVVTKNKQGMARGAELRELADHNGLPLISIEELIRYRLRQETLVELAASARVPSRYGELRCEVWRSLLDGVEHVAMIHGDVAGDEPALVRVHSECVTGDVLGSQRCDCGAQLDNAFRQIQAAGRGVVLYLRGQEGRGIGLAHKLNAYNLQDQGLDTVDANTHLGLPVDTREYGIGAQILSNLGVRRMRLMTNNPAKYSALAAYGLEIVERVVLHSPVTDENIRYLSTKRDRLGHLLPPDLTVEPDGPGPSWRPVTPTSLGPTDSTLASRVS